MTRCPAAIGTQSAVCFTTNGSSEPYRMTILLGSPFMPPQIPGIGYFMPTTYV